MTNKKIIQILESFKNYLCAGNPIWNTEGVKKAFDLAIEALKAQDSNRWIPCSERLPSDDEEVIVSILDDSGDTSFSYTTLGWHYKGFWIVDNSRCSMVKAWMPLPEPYEEKL